MAIHNGVERGVHCALGPDSGDIIIEVCVHWVDVNYLGIRPLRPHAVTLSQKCVCVYCNIMQ